LSAGAAEPCRYGGITGSFPKRLIIKAGANMRNFSVLVAVLLALISCRTITPTSYNPNPMNVDNPISVMKDTIQQQPAAYAYMPADVEVDDKCTKLYMESSRPRAMPILGGGGGVVVGPGSSNVSLEPVCYKNIGRIGLSHIERGNLWRVEIDDRNGNYMYWVYSYEKT
jgi:hypothetical protein